MRRVSIIIRTYWNSSPSSSGEDSIREWAIIELQGDLETRGNKCLQKQFIGDLSYNKYGQPILIIGHHILTGKEVKFEKPMAILHKNVFSEEKQVKDKDEELDDSIDDTILLNESHLHQPHNNTTVLDTTVAIENKTKVRTEYTVEAIVKKKLVFKTRPKPIIANVPDWINNLISFNATAEFL